MARVDDWFLGPEERGNPATGIDRRRGDGRAWTEGNRVEALVHGAEYYRRLLAALRTLRAGDLVAVSDWRGDADQRLDGPGRVQPWAAWWAAPVYRTLVDPDGRPRRLRRAGRF